MATTNEYFSTGGPTAVQKRRIRRWVEALRSGKYRQAKNQLRVGDRFCCLGVACDLAAKPLKLKWDNEDLAIPRFDRYTTQLSPAVQRYYGFATAEPKVTGEFKTVAALNDEGGWGFKRLATAIERTYLTPAKAAKR